MSEVAVVIPVFNRPEAVGECLDCVADQTRAATELVVVDDGSTDETPDVVRAWIRSRSMGRLIEQPHAGAPAARNRGMDATTADLVAFLDSDDLWPRDHLERALAVLDAEPDAVAATADIRIQRPGRPDKLRDLRPMASRPVRHLFKGPGIGSATVVRRHALTACGGYDEAVPTGHDIKLYLELALRGRWHHVPGAPITKREGIVGPRLSAAYEDRGMRWAEQYEAFARAHPDADPTLARLVGRRWFRAARWFRRRGDVERARRCYRRSIAWRPFGLRARLGLRALRRASTPGEAGR